MLRIQVSIGTMGIGMGALVAGLFGMNVSVLHELLFRCHDLMIIFQLANNLEQSPYAFAAMSALSAAIALLVSWGGMRK